MLIGLLGKKRTGKDTIADYLCKNYNFKKLSFAKPLKDVCKILFNFNDEQLYGDKKEEIDTNWGTTPRIIMQYLGTDIFRNDINKILPNIGNNFWIKCIRTQYQSLLKTDPLIKVVISDVRFQNELDMIHELDGCVIKIERQNSKNYFEDLHESEKDIDKIKNYDFLIKNDSTFENLYLQVDDIIKKYK